MLISSQWATLKMFKKKQIEKVDYTRMGNHRDAHLTYSTYVRIYLFTCPQV